MNSFYQSQLIFSPSKQKEPCSQHSPWHSPALHFLQAVTFGKKPPQNDIRKSCAPLMWLWVCFIATLHKVGQKLILHASIQHCKAVQPDGDLRWQAKTAHQDILGLQLGKYISGSHCSQTAHSGKAQGWCLQPRYKWFLPGNLGAPQVLKRFHNAPNCWVSHCWHRNVKPKYWVLA